MSSPSSVNWSKNNTPVTKNKLQFTMKREYDKAREEAVLVKQLRNVSICISIRFIVFYNIAVIASLLSINIS